MIGVYSRLAMQNGNGTQFWKLPCRHTVELTAVYDKIEHVEQSALPSDAIIIGEVLRMVHFGVHPLPGKVGFVFGPGLTGEVELPVEHPGIVPQTAPVKAKIDDNLPVISWCEGCPSKYDDDEDDDDEDEDEDEDEDDEEDDYY